MIHSDGVKVEPGRSRRIASSVHRNLHKSNYRSHRRVAFNSILAKFVTLSALAIEVSTSVPIDGPAPFYVYDFKRYWYYYASLIPVGTLLLLALYLIYAAPKPPPARLPLMPTVMYDQ